MTPYYSDSNCEIYHGDCRRILPELPAESVQTCVTSPPYWGLRDYGIAPSVWGGDPECSHRWQSAGGRRANPDRSSGDHDQHGNGIFVDRIPRGTQAAKTARGAELHFGDTCTKCGAWCGSFGLEPTPRMYVEHAVEIFREVWRVLKPDGTLWLNLGDTYANDAKWGGSTGGKHADALHGGSGIGRRKVSSGLKPKDMVGIPWRVAFALQADGWWLRQDIIWSKPNPMPESVTDRCTKSHEYIFLLSKSERYYYDADAIREPASPNTHARISQDVANQVGSYRANGGAKHNGPMKAVVRKPSGWKSGPGNHRDLVGHYPAEDDIIRSAGVSPKSVEYDGFVKANNIFHAATCLPVENRNKRSVWTVATQPFKEAHFATFPPDLIKPCILAGAPVGGVVLDPFGGAGTTAMVAKELGRRAIGCELNEEYITITIKRLQQEVLSL